MQEKNKRGVFSRRMGALGLGILSGIAEKGSLSIETVLGGIHGLPKHTKRESVRTTLWRLQKKGLVERTQEGKFKLSERGTKFMKQKERPPEEPWDGKWRLITFDVPEKRRSERDWLRNALMNAGYTFVQRSVFLGKKPIPRVIFETIQERDLSEFVRLIIIGEIDDETLLKQATQQ